MNFMVEEYDDTLRLLIKDKELAENGYDIWACVGNPALLDAFIARLVKQLIEEDGLVLTEEAKARIHMVCDTLIITFMPNTAYFTPLEEYKNSEQFQKDKECHNPDKTKDFANQIREFLEGKEESTDKTDYKTVYSIRGSLDMIIEVSHVLKRQKTPIKESILYKNEEGYRLEFSINGSPLVNDIIERDLSDYQLDMRKYNTVRNISIDYGNEHGNVIIRKDAVKKLNKAW